MQRLKAIRDRMSAQTELEDGGAAAEEDRVPERPAAGETLSAAEALRALVPPPGTPREPPPPAPTAIASMWDMVGDDDLLDDDAPLPDLEGLLADPPADTHRPFPGFPAAVPDASGSAAPRSTPFAPAPAAALAPAPAPAPRPAPAPAPVATPFAPRPDAWSEIRHAPEPVAEAPRRTGRVKTRLLGFEHSSGRTTDIFDRDEPAPNQPVRFPVGWLVVVDGPGRGTSIALLAGVSQIGRDEGQAVQLDFGDTSISRANHAAIAFDDEADAFFVGHGGKSNLVRLNGRPLLSTERMNSGDTLTIGETRLRLVALCGESFSWNDPQDNPSATGR